MQQTRIVVTGLGIISPIGQTVNDFWLGLLSGRSGASPISSFDPSSFRTETAAEVKGFSAERHLDLPKANLWPRATQMAGAACQMAIQDAALDGPQLAERCGIAIGASIGEQKILQQFGTQWLHYCSNGLRVHGDEPSCSSIADSLAVYFGLTGPVAAVFNSCASGNYAVAYACDAIRAGRADCMIAGAADAFSRTAFGGFSALRLITDEPCRPFDRRRKGFFLGEGAGIMVLERLDCARRRQAPILAEVRGSGITSDAHHFLTPSVEGKAAAMRLALQDAQVDLDEVDYINAHGNATWSNDRAETAGVKEVFGASAFKIPVTSIKSLTGHCMAASSAFEAIACVLCIQNSVIPPTWNYQEKDPDCDLDYLPGSARQQKVDVALNNSFAFGGANSSLVLGRLKGK